MYYMSRTVRRVDSLGDSCQDVMLVYPIYKHGTGPHISLGGGLKFYSLSLRKDASLGKDTRGEQGLIFFRNLMC